MSGREGSRRGTIKGLWDRFSGSSDGYIPAKQRERIVARFREKGVADDDFPPEWYLEMTYELWHLGGVEGMDLWDLVNTSRSYPKAIPVMLDWLRDLDDRMPGPATRWNTVAREGLNRALTVTEARGTVAPDLMIAQFYHRPPFDHETLFTAANALNHLAGPEYFDQIAKIVQARPEGRTPLIDWLGRSRRKDAVPMIADQLDDPDVATTVMKVLRRKTLSPELAAEIRPHVERYLDYPGDKDRLPGELRKQAKLTMNKLYPTP